MLAAVMLLGPAAWAQTNTQELPLAPSTMQPRFPGAPLQAAPAPATAPANTSPLTTLPPAHVPPAAAQDSTTGQEPAKAGGSARPDAAQSEAEEPGEYRIGVEVDLVDVVFTATDKRGHFIKDLKQDDIRLLDEGKPPAQIEAFESESGLPLRVGLLIDASNSIRDRFRFEQEAAVQFLQQVVRPKSDLAFVIGFDSETDMTQDYTDNTDALGNGIRVLRPGGGTALHDAVLAACEKLSKAPVAGSARRAIILLSDGDDNQSRHTREEAIGAALHAGVIVYVIDTDVTESNKKGDRVLTRYADATGGRVFFPLGLDEVAKAFSAIQDELRSQYVVAYKPQNFNEDGSYHAITIDAPNRSNVKIRARKGYYAPKGKG
ncbi:MAG: VWA domain-containing protein [Candidatus Korobacteraceae bacterium]